MMKTAMRRGIEALLRPCRPRRTEVAEKANLTRRSIRDRILTLCCGKENGQSLVEFALTAPILIAVLTGIFELGLAFNNQLQLTQAVGSGAQYLQQIRLSTTDPCKDVLSAIKGSAPSLNPANITLTLTMNGNSPVTASTCSGDQSELVWQQPATVYATYPCNISIYGLQFSSACKLSAQVTEYEY
jgi:Flp pilus assembly protein TadG